MKSARPVFFIITFALCPFCINAQFTNYEIDSTFNVGNSIREGYMSTMLTHDNGNVFASGLFEPWSLCGSAPLFDNSGNCLGSVHQQPVMRAQHFKEGYIMIGSQSGLFRSITPLQTDPVFDFPYDEPPFSSNQFPRRLRDIQVIENDHIVVAGRFQTSSTLTGTDEDYDSLGHLCIIDSTGALAEGFPIVHCGEPQDAIILSVLPLPSGGYLVSGNFTEIEGHPYKGLAKLNPDFSVNTGFPHIFSETDNVFIRLLDSQERVWVSFGSQAQLTDLPDYETNLIRINLQGDIDEGLNQIIFDNNGEIVEDSDGSFIMSSNLTLYGQRLTKFTDSGTMVDGVFDNLQPDAASWDVGGVSGSQWVTTIYLTHIRKVENDKLLVGGRFSSFGGQPFNFIVRLQPSGVVVSTQDQQQLGNLKLYPNPARDHFRIEMPDGIERLQTIELHDIQGRLVRTWPAAQSPYATDGLPAGIYVVRAGGPEGVFTQKLVLE